MSTAVQSSPVFQKEAFQKPNFWQRLLGKQPPRNALIALKNLLAEKPVLEIEESEIQAIPDQYGCVPEVEFPEELGELFRAYLEYCLKDQHFSEDEARAVAHLKHLLGLSERRTRKIQEEVSQEVYKEAVDEAVRDGILTEEEEQFLDQLREQLWLPEDTWKELTQQSIRERMSRLMEEITEDAMISPEEEKQLEQVVRSLNVDMRMDEADRRAFEQMKLFWQIENAEELPTIQPAYNLQKNEEAYLQANGDWYETRSRTQRINYGGPAARIRIAKGIYYTAGSANIQRIRTEELKHIEHGEMLLTNKRFLFIGQERSKQIRLNQILAFEPFRDGVQLKKSSGRSPYIYFENEDEAQLFSMFMNRLLYKEKE